MVPAESLPIDHIPRTVLSGLGAGPVRRLQQTWKLLPSKLLNQFKACIELVRYLDDIFQILFFIDIFIRTPYYSKIL